MKYAIKQELQPGFDFYIKSVDVAQRALSVEPDIEEAKHFDSKEDAQLYMKHNVLTGKSFSIVPVPVQQPEQKEQVSLFGTVNTADISAAMFAKTEFVDWLNQLIVAGGKKNVEFARVQGQLIEYLFSTNETPESAVERIIEVLRRVDAINADGKE